MRLFGCACGEEAAPAGRAETRRQKLIATARTLFADHGFHGTGMAQLAAASGIKVGQIYRDFPSKEAIVAAIVESDLAAFLDEAALEAAVAARDRPAVRRWIVGVVCGEDDGRGKLMPEICAEAARNARIAAIMDELDARVRADLAAALRVFAPEPDKTDEVAATIDLILTLSTGVAVQRNIRPARDLSALCSRIAALIDGELAVLAGCAQRGCNASHAIR